MIPLPPKQPDPIDAVITWVNGNSARHQEKRRRYMADAQVPLLQNAVNPHRWACNDEILYCLQSIHNHAPWTRKIWIVVDEETPNLSRLPPALRAKVTFVFHRDIFGEYGDALPTFNSLAIEGLLWRIKGLAERFLYFNDDVFLTSPIVPSDLFAGDAPVLRGKWVDYSALDQDKAKRLDPAKFNHFMQVNAARLMGFDVSRLFRTAHVVHPMRQSVMQHLFQEHRAAFEDSIKHRFRAISQFLPQGLHNHACIRDGAAVIHTAKDHVHITSGQGKRRVASKLERLLDETGDTRIKFLCINDLPQLEKTLPDARDLLEQVVGGFADRRIQVAG